MFFGDILVVSKVHVTRPALQIRVSVMINTYRSMTNIVLVRF